TAAAEPARPAAARGAWRASARSGSPRRTMSGNFSSALVLECDVKRQSGVGILQRQLRQPREQQSPLRREFVREEATWLFDLDVLNCAGTRDREFHDDFPSHSLIRLPVALNQRH